MAVTARKLRAVAASCYSRRQNVFNMLTDIGDDLRLGYTLYTVLINLLRTYTIIYLSFYSLFYYGK